MVAAAIGSSSPAYWYLTRATGVVALVLLTLVVALGIANVSRLSSPHWPRFVTDGVHRRTSMLALSFLAIHILTTVLDSYVSISLVDAVIPFHGSYRPVWLGFGAVAFDLLLAVIVTSLLRARVGAGAWRAVHWLAYACWPVAVIHGLGTGTDSGRGWMLGVYLICSALVLAALWVRARATADPAPARRAVLRGGISRAGEARAR